MRDHLLDLVSHTHDLGCIDLVKIIGTDTDTRITGLADDKSVVVEASFAAPVADFVGTFGMPNLNKLKVLLNLEEYREQAKMTITRRGDAPESLNFENATGDFKNGYRFMAPGIVNEKLKNVSFLGTKWNIEFEPTMISIQRLKMQAQAMATEPHFYIRTEGKNLKFFFGDHSSHDGSFVFQAGVAGEIKRAWAYPVATVIAILSLIGDKIMRITDDGAMKITVNSGLAVYNYILPAQSK